jgi:hypothetical protein
MAGEYLLGAVRAAVGALESLGLDYALFGGIAVNAWGRIRATRDADILLSAARTDPDRLCAAFRNAGFSHQDRVDRVRLSEAGILRFWYPAGVLGLSIKVDVVLGSTDYHDTVVSRRVVRRAFGEEFAFASLEDCILLKLLAGRPVDLADSVELLAIHAGNVDRSYLESVAPRLGVARALDECLAGAAGPPNPY